MSVLAQPKLNPGSQPWAGAVTGQIVGNGVDIANAQRVATIADVSLGTAITRSAGILANTAMVAEHLLSLAVVAAESRTNAIEV